MKILIAVPTFENIFPDTFKSIYDVDKAGHECLFEFVRGYDIATARNKIGRLALDLNVDYVLMVDNDVVLPHDAIVNLLDDAKDVCLGYYAHRGVDNIYHGRTSICKVGYFNYPLESEYTAEEMETLEASGQYKIIIHGGGMGCALISTNMFRRIKYPWFAWVDYGDQKRGMLSEDLYFCEQARTARTAVWTDSRVCCGHMLRHVQWPDPIEKEEKP